MKNRIMHLGIVLLFATPLLRGMEKTPEPTEEQLQRGRKIIASNQFDYGRLRRTQGELQVKDKPSDTDAYAAHLFIVHALQNCDSCNDKPEIGEWAPDILARLLRTDCRLKATIKGLATSRNWYAGIEYARFYPWGESTLAIECDATPAWGPGYFAELAYELGPLASRVHTLTFNNGMISEGCFAPLEKLFMGLMHLTLDNQQLGLIPEGITAVTTLEHLSLKNNGIRIIPKDIANLTQLRWLDLCGNKIFELPECLAPCKALGFLNVRENCLGISDIPQYLRRGGLVVYFGDQYRPIPACRCQRKGEVTAQQSTEKHQSDDGSA